MTNRNYKQRTVYRIKRLYQTLRARIDEALDPLGLSMPLFGALAVLGAEESLSNAALARLNFVTPQTMQRIVSSLEGNGLIVRDLSGAGRSGRFQLSEEGRRKVEEAQVLVKQIEAQIMDALPPEDAAIFLQSLDRSAEGLSS